MRQLGDFINPSVTKRGWQWKVPELAMEVSFAGTSKLFIGDLPLLRLTSFDQSGTIQKMAGKYPLVNVYITMENHHAING